VVNNTPWQLHPGERDKVPIVQEAEWTSGLVWMGVENFATTGIHSSNFPARSQLFYQLCYPGWCTVGITLQIPFFVLVFALAMF